VVVEQEMQHLLFQQQQEMDNLEVQVEEQVLQMLTKQDLETHHQLVHHKEAMVEQQRFLRQLEEHLVAVVVLLLLVVMDLFQEQVETEERELLMIF
jgi:hypothetical protein